MMSGDDRGRIRAAEIVLPCDDLAATLGFFIDRLGYRVEMIVPADAPAVAVIVGHGIRLRLERGGGAAGTIRLACEAPDHIPGGARPLSAPHRKPLRIL